MTQDINDKIRIHTAGGIELNEPVGGWNFGSRAGGEYDEESIASNGLGQVPRWLRFTTFKELEGATVRSKSIKMLNASQTIGALDTLLLNLSSDSGFSRHLVCASMAFRLDESSLHQLRPRVFLTAKRSRIGPTDSANAYQAVCFSRYGEMLKSQMSVSVYTSVSTPNDRSPLSIDLTGRVQGSDLSVAAMDGSLFILSWHDPD